jgi:hypothetical protein
MLPFLRRLLNRNMMLQAQLDVLEECGIVPTTGVGITDLLVRFREREYETRPFRRLLIALGGEANDAARSPLSDNIWHVRAGCITGPGDYARVALRMSRLSGSSLPITEVTDEFDLRRGVAWLRFRCGGSQLEWPARIQEQWIDSRILSRFVRLLAEQEGGKRFTLLDLGGQDYLVGCSTPEQFVSLRKQTGLGFEWLD